MTVSICVIDALPMASAKKKNLQKWLVKLGSERARTIEAETWWEAREVYVSRILGVPLSQVEEQASRADIFCWKKSKG